MLILNYTHPLNADQVAQIAQMVGSEPEVRTIPVKIDNTQPLVPQMRAMVDAAGLTPDEWQTTPFIINPPGLAPATSVLLAEIHGLIGHFPSIIRLRPVVGSTPVAYEVAEIVNLQVAREESRERR